MKMVALLARKGDMDLGEYAFSTSCKIENIKSFPLTHFIIKTRT